MYKGCDHLMVALAVPTELGEPVGRVDARSVLMLGATMPEAAVQEDGETLRRKSDISVNSDRASYDQVLISKPQPVPVQLRSDSDLGLGIGLPVAAHHAGDCRSQWHRVRHAFASLPAGGCRPSAQGPSLWAQ